jgi:uncharacterized protein (DUF2062 family)
MKLTNITELHTADLYKKLKSLKSEKIINAVLIAVGIFAYSGIVTGFGLGSIIALILAYFFIKNAKNRDALEKEVVNELNSRESK